MVKISDTTTLAKPVNYNKNAVESKSKTGSKKTDAPSSDALASGRKLDSSEISALKEMADQANENLRRIVENLILKQGSDYQIFKINGLASRHQSPVSDIEKAKSAISEDGEFGVKAVSDRLVNFAISISGGDKTKVSELKLAIDNGFAAAKNALGGYLPPICNETYNETMRKLDAWVQES